MQIDEHISIINNNFCNVNNNKINGKPTPARLYYDYKKQRINEFTDYLQLGLMKAYFIYR